MLDLNKMAEKAYKIAVKRAQKGQIEDPRYDIDNLKHCAGEIIEAEEAFYKWGITGISLENATSKKDKKRLEKRITEKKAEFALEISDIIMCCLTIAANERIDIERSLFDCLLKNEGKLIDAEQAGDKRKNER